MLHQILTPFRRFIGRIPAGLRLIKINYNFFFKFWHLYWISYPVLWCVSAYIPVPFTYHEDPAGCGLFVLVYIPSLMIHYIRTGHRPKFDWQVEGKGTSWTEAHSIGYTFAEYKDAPNDTYFDLLNPRVNRRIDGEWADD